MSLQRRIPWNAALRDVREDRAKIPAGLLSARALVQPGTRTRPLVVASRYDRATIMAAACKAASGIRERCGVSRAEGHVLRPQGHVAGPKAAHRAAAH